ncbi:MAG: tRNA pseudouridine(55) synthase TruB [Planctomycetota bacterium]
MTTPQPDAKLSGLLVIDKPLGWSSMTVCRKVRSAAGGRVKGPNKLKVGHAGTLDPLATGVLVVCIGKATRHVEQVMGQGKVYEAAIDLSAFTASDDGEMPREEVQVDRLPTDGQIDAALVQQTGLIEQVPPNFSAVHIDGQRAYKAARQGEPLDLKPRQVRIDAIERLAYDWPVLRLRIACGKGTYIRSIARDLGRLLHTGGHLTALRRTAVGGYTVDQAFPVDDLEKGLTQQDLLPMPVNG